MGSSVQFANNTTGTVTSGGTTAPASGTTENWTVTASGFPSSLSSGQYFHVADTDSVNQSEKILVTSISGSTWTVTRGDEGTTPVAHSANFTVQQVVTSGDFATEGRLQPYQFRPEDFGAKRNGAFLYDCHITTGQNVLTTAGLPAPNAPTVSNSGTGGSLAAGTYQIEVTYVNPFGETVASASSSTTTTGTTSSITVTAVGSYSNATGYYVYCTTAGGATFFRQQTAGTPTSLQEHYVITTVSTSGANPPASNTTSSAPFTSADVGKYICVSFAGGGTSNLAALCTTISGFTNSSTVTLTANAANTVAGVGAVYGTDDTTAINNTVTAAVNYALSAVNGDAEVLFTQGIYCLGGATQQCTAPSGFPTGASGVGGNAQIPLPMVDPQTGVKVSLTLRCPSRAGGPEHWTQPNPDVHGAVLASMLGNKNKDATYGAPSVIGGPTLIGQGGGALFSNMRLIVEGITVLATYWPSMAGIDLLGVGQADIRSFDYKCMAVSVSAGTASNGTPAWPYYQSATTLGNNVNWGVFAYRCPSSGNNDQNDVGELNSYGPYVGVVFTDHFNATTLRCLYGYGAVTAYGGSSAGTLHHSWIASLSSEAISYPLFFPTSGDYAQSGSDAIPLTVGIMQLENASYVVNDANNALYGQVMGVEFLADTGATTLSKNGGANFRVYWTYQVAGKMSSPPAVPGSTTAYQNQFWRDATVIVSGGTVTQIDLDGVNTGQTSGMFFVRNGGTITLTYSVAPTWNWILA